ncbi:MAG: STAS domain-containing protein [Isosphaeraceae bacterium]
MPTPDFQHIRLSMVGDVTLVEILTKDLQGPAKAQELGTELARVTAQEWAKRLLVDFRRNDYLSSSVFAVLFKLVTQAQAEGRQVKLCNMAPEMLIGADIVGLPKLVKIHENQGSALRAFEHA